VSGTSITVQSKKDLPDDPAARLLDRVAALDGNRQLMVPGSSAHTPFTPSIWRLVTEKFYLHDALQKVMERSKKRASSTYLVKRHGGEVLEMFTAALARKWPLHVTVSTTHFRESKLTVGVIFGCTKRQMRSVEWLLRDARDVASHRLLPFGLFAELNRNSMNDEVSNVMNDINKIISRLFSTDTSQLIRLSDADGELRECRRKIRSLEETVMAAKRQLDQMFRQAEDWTTQTQVVADNHGSERLADEDYTTNTLRFKYRFEEISLELDDMLAICRRRGDEITDGEELVTTIPEASNWSCL
jgi:hypothetical protein